MRRAQTKFTTPKQTSKSSIAMSSSLLAPPQAQTRRGYDTSVGRFAREWNANLSHAYVWGAYVIAGGIGALAAFLINGNVVVGDQPLLLAGVADVAATVVVWVAAIITNNSSLYDPYWSVFTPLATIYWALVADNGTVPLARTVLVNVSVWVWAWRLTTNWSFAWTGLGHQDWRYTDIESYFRDKGTYVLRARCVGCVLF
jgi:steroid 5-alpha reductase family enzyme